MAASRQDITAWFEEGKRKGATKMIVVCDTFDYEDYPHFIMPDEDAKQIAHERYGYNVERGGGMKEMQKVMECYDLATPLADQLREYRAFHW